MFWLKILLPVLTLFLALLKKRGGGFDKASTIFLVVGTLGSITVITYDDQHATDLGRKNKEQETLLYAVNEYGDESKLNMIGKTGRFDSSFFIESTPISKMLEGTYEIESGSIKNISCGSSALSKYKSIIKLDPKFPFSYFVLASCLKRNDDPSWRTYALTGKEILEMTTRIGGHHPNHDTALRDLQEMLKE